MLDARRHADLAAEILSVSAPGASGAPRPLVVRGAVTVGFLGRERFLTAHGDVELGVSTGVAVATRGPSSPEVQRMPLREFATRLRDGSLPDAYSFCDVGARRSRRGAVCGRALERLATHALPPKLRDEVRQPSHGLPGRVRLAFGGARA